MRPATAQVGKNAQRGTLLRHDCNALILWTFPPCLAAIMLTSDERNCARFWGVPVCSYRVSMYDGSRKSATMRRLKTLSQPGAATAVATLMAVRQVPQSSASVPKVERMVRRVHWA